MIGELSPTAKATIDAIQRPVIHPSPDRLDVCALVSTGSAGAPIDEDDEFGYALKGEEREGEFFRKEYRAEVLPQHLLTNVGVSLIAGGSNVIEEGDEDAVESLDDVAPEGQRVWEEADEAPETGTRAVQGAPPNLAVAANAAPQLPSILSAAFAAAHELDVCGATASVAGEQWTTVASDDQQAPAAGVGDFDDGLAPAEALVGAPLKQANSSPVSIRVAVAELDAVVARVCPHELTPEVEEECATTVLKHRDLRDVGAGLTGRADGRVAGIVCLEQLDITFDDFVASAVAMGGCAGTQGPVDIEAPLPALEADGGASMTQAESKVPCPPGSDAHALTSPRSTARDPPVHSSPWSRHTSVTSCQDVSVVEAGVQAATPPLVLPEAATVSPDTSGGAAGGSGTPWEEPQISGLVQLRLQESVVGAPEDGSGGDEVADKLCMQECREITHALSLGQSSLCADSDQVSPVPARTHSTSPICLPTLHRVTNRGMVT
jgi:hypothetical protein